jgi:dipeptidyl aminopeptidase/acylaminoacyl peptidase
MRGEVNRRSKRWYQQRWLMDTVVETIGIEWDQERLVHYARPAGPAAAGVFRAAGARMKKFTDAHREFAAAGRRVQGLAKQYAEEDRLVPARESYITASLLWSAARWPLYEIDDRYRDYEAQIISCYDKYIELAPHPIERVDIPFGDGALSGMLHLPYAPAAGEKFPCVVNIGGMDGCKENVVSMYGDPYLERGFAVLAMDGPGQGECPGRGIFATPNNHGPAAVATFDWLEQHAFIDPEQLVIRATSFGTYFSLAAAAALGNRVKGIAQAFVIHEPGCYTIFNAASPTFRMRFMMMSNVTDDDEFDTFCEGFDPRPFAEKITCPILILAGEDDELSPVEYSYDVYDCIKSPKNLVVYEGAKHSMGGASSVAQGPHFGNMMADWLKDRTVGKPTGADEKQLVDMYGKIHAR